MFFIVIVMYSPGGLASLLMQVIRVVRRGMIGRIAGLLAFASAAVLVALTGIAAMIEMLYYLTLESGSGTVMKLFGMETDVHHQQQSEMGGSVKCRYP